ncbi:uncharacterized protein LOC114525851 isoform X2 [Dendronephthya gigantea]|uniref:uncharacterized protein LOC114525851 isoform X2 n=1 Tax=Dendronephthya gigantea TaxID=151771 RepID=UPI00106D08BB|nr:uncharacterized protein LOC114525851 isoform X2 [Dendronephthya gigantea]
MFVMTLNGKDLDSLLYSYEDFCRKLNCNESVLKNLLSSSKRKDEKIKDLRLQISNRIKHWKKWWIIVDNVENLELISPLLPLIGGDVWNNGQIIVTTQNTNAVPSDSLSSKHISLSLAKMSGMPWDNEERQNYIRALYIVTWAVRKELRKFFIQEWNKLYQASLGAWDDTNVSGQKLFNLEKKRTRPNFKFLHSKFQKGNTNEWDCTVLFGAILYSNSISCYLKSHQKNELDTLRKLRNIIIHEIPEKTLTNKDFQTMTTKVENALGALGLSTNEVVQIKNLFALFKILPPAPTHEVVSRSDKIQEITKDLEKLRSDNNNNDNNIKDNNNNGKLTYFYISGNPGSGKSQLARQVCEDIWKNVHAKHEAMFVMTLNGKDLDSLLYSYEDFCRKLNCNESVLKNLLSSSKPKDEKIKDLRSQISSRIKHWKKWWIIVDNVENLELIYPLLPLMGDDVWNNGQIIVTTQNKNAVPSDSLSSKHISLSLGMNDQECRQLLALLSRTGVNDSLLDEVAEKLDRQPLAMAAAAAYMGQVIESLPDFSWRVYLEKLEKGRRELTEERLKQTNSAAYSSTMSAAVLLAVTKCAEENKILGHAFNLFSLISFEPLPLDLVVKYIQQEDEELDAEDIILPIKHCSLFVHVGNKESNIRLHRVVHEAVKIFCLPKEPKIDNTSESEVPRKRKKTIHNHLEAVARKVLKTLYHFEDRKDKIKLISHLKAFNAEINKLFPNDGLNIAGLNLETISVYQFFGDILCDFSEFKLSEEFLQQAMKMALEQFGPNDINLFDCYNYLGVVCNKKGDQKQSLDYHQEALKIVLEHLGSNDIKVAVSYNNLGSVFFTKGDFEQAGDFYQRALKIELLQLKPNQVNVAASYNNLGNVCSEKGDLKQALDYHQKSLEIKLEQLKENHIDVADSYNNLGNVCCDKGDLEQASDYYQRTLNIRLEQLGPDHVDVARSYNNLGIVCHNKGDLEQASDYYERGLEILLQQFGPSHVDVASAYLNLGGIYYKKGDLEHAEEYYQKALSIQLEKFGPKHIDVAKSYQNLGSVYHDKGDLKQAEEYHQQALKIRFEILGPNHFDVAKSYHCLGDVYCKKNDLEKGGEYYQRALKIQLEQLGPDHIDVATTYSSLGMMWNIKGDEEKAIEYYQLALKIRLEKFGGNHADVAATYRKLGHVYIDLGDEEKAKEYYQRADLIDKGDQEESSPKVPGEIITLTGSKDEWFKETILDENYDMKAVYVNELRNERLSWLKDFSIGINKEKKSWQMCITYARNTKPCMQDLKNVFGDNIAPFVKFTEESDDKDEYLQGPSSGDTLCLRNNDIENRGTLTILANQTSNPGNRYAVTCYHVCYCHENFPNDITEQHRRLKDDCSNDATGCRRTECYYIHGNEFELGEFECGLYDDSNDIALIKLTPGLTLDRAIALLGNGVQSELLSKQEVGNIFERCMAEGKLPTVKKYGAVTNETQGELHSITSMRLSDGRNLGFYGIQETREGAFAERGDSGSLVCIIDEDKKLPFAMVCNRTGQVFYCSNLRNSLEALIRRHEMMNIQPILN